MSIKTSFSNLCAVLKEILDGKVDKVSGKGLSTNDFTTAYKTKLDGIATGANKTIVDSALSGTSTNPVQNKVVAKKIGTIETNVSAAATTAGNAAASAAAVKKDLANYYKKTETYSQTEINNKISAIPKFDIKVCEALPDSNISKTTVYLLKSPKEETNNLYDEYIYVNSKWEKLGTQTVGDIASLSQRMIAAEANIKQNTSSISTINANVAKKQDKLTAGTNITISGTTISAKDTTYSDATQSAHGLMTAEDKKKLDDLAHAESISSLVFKNGNSKTYMGVKFSGNRVSARFLIMENNGRRADIYVSIRIGIDTKATVYASWNTDTEFRIFYDDEDCIYVVFNCSDWSRGSCISTIENALMTEWNGTSYPSNLTAIATEIRYTLDSVNFTRYALAKDGTAKKAEDLTDSGWVDTTKNTTFTATSTVKCRKYGQLVEVRGEVTFNSTYGSPTVCTLPAGYRPAAVVHTCGYTPSGKIFGIKVDTAGVVSFSSDSGSTFVNGTTYRVDLTYLLG